MGIASVGIFLTAVAWTPWLVIPALTVASAAEGLGAILRALLNAIVEPHTIATLNTTVSMLEALVGLPGGPGFGWLLSRGIDLGGVWMGIPFLLGSLLSMIGFGFMLAFRIPTGFAVAHAPS